MEHIKASLETGLPVHLMTSDRVKFSCAKCGKEFETWIRDNKPLSTICLECRRKEQDAEEQQKAELKLPEIMEEQRWVWVEQCNISVKFLNKSFDDFEQKLQPKAYQAMKAYNGESSILLLSPDTYGVGKTHLIAALLNHIIETEKPAYIGRFNHIERHSCPVYYTTETQLLARIRRTFELDKRGDGETESDVYRQLETVELLALDDVGKVRPRDYSFTQGVYFRVVDSRYNSELPIVIATNLNFVEFEEHIGGASADRLREMCGKGNIVVMQGQSYRKGNKVREGI